jgi:hypothetical protein
MLKATENWQSDLPVSISLEAFSCSFSFLELSFSREPAYTIDTPLLNFLFTLGIIYILTPP